MRPLLVGEQIVNNSNLLEIADKQLYEKTYNEPLPEGWTCVIEFSKDYSEALGRVCRGEVYDSSHNDYIIYKCFRHVIK